MKQTLPQVIDAILKSKPMRPSANKLTDQFVIDYLKGMQHWDDSFFTHQTLYDLFTQIKQTQNVELLRGKKENFLQDEKVSTTTEFYQFLNQHHICFYNFVEYDQKYNFDARLTELLQSEQNFVQSNNTNWETMLSFFGNYDKIMQTIQKLITELGSPMITVDSERHKLFIKSNDGCLISCELLFTETLEESLQNPMDIKIYYDGFKTRHVPEISSKFETWGLNAIGARKINPQDIFQRWINRSYPHGFIMKQREITFKQHILHRCGLFNEDANIELVDNEFIIYDPKMCCYISGVISQSIAQIIYVLKHSENLTIEHSEMLYNARKSLDCNVSKYYHSSYLTLRFDVDFTRNDNRIRFNQVSLCLYS
jgi:hypothetical protein